MKNTASAQKREELIVKGFDYLTQCGLENASIRTFGKDHFESASNMYVYFSNKNEWIVETTKYGLTVVVEEMYNFLYANISDLQNFSVEVVDELVKIQPHLRLVCQVAASPVYGQLMRDKANELHANYNEYTQKLSEKLGCPPEVIYSCIFHLISIIMDFVVWDDRAITEMQLADWYETVKMKVENNKR